MKTGGSMNFLKKAGAILMFLAIFASSCNKYADDFAQLNTKLDALATSVGGVSTLQADMTTLKATVASIQTAIGTLATSASVATLKTSLDGVVTSIGLITTKLNDLATAGSATKLVVDGIKADLKTLSDKITADNAAIKLKIDALAATDVLQSAQLQAIIDANVALKAQIALITGSATDTDPTALTIKGLQLMLDAQKVTLDKLLANSNMFTGDVMLTTDTEVDFFYPYISAWADGGIINGKLTVKTANITAGAKMDKLNAMTNNIIATIGAFGSVDVVVTAAKNAGFAKLTTVAQAYSVTGADVADLALKTVYGNVTFDYDGAYEALALTSVGGNLVLTDKAANTVTGAVGTTKINFPTVAVTGLVGDGTGLGVVSWPLALTVDLSGGVSSLTAAKATSVRIGTTAYTAGLVVNAVKAVTVDLSTAATAVAAVTITADPTAMVKLDAFKSSVPVTINKVLTISLPKYPSNLLSAPEATMVTLAVHDGVMPPYLPAVTSLTMGALNTPLFALQPYYTLTTVDITGKTAATWAALKTTVTTSRSNTALATVKLAGNLLSADLTGLAKLTSLTTSGILNNLRIDGAEILTGVAGTLNLGHTFYVGGDGSQMIVNNNPLMTEFSSGIQDYPAVITITNNVKLAKVDLSSYITKLYPAVGALTTITVNNNNLGAVYTAAKAITPTTPYAETVISGSNFLLGLKTFVASYPAVPGPPNLVMAINLDKVTLVDPITLVASTTTATLSSRMVADTGHTMVPGGAPFNFGTSALGITIAKEFTLVQ